MTTIDPNMNLDRFGLQDALVSLYSTFAAALLGYGATDSPDFYQREIPEMVLEAAVGAGWLDFVEEVPWHPSSKAVPKWVLQYKKDLLSRFTEDAAQSPVKFGQYYVDRAYADSFL